MTRISWLRPIVIAVGIAMFGVPAYGQYTTVPVYEDNSTSPLGNLASGFSSNPSDGGVQNTSFGWDALANVGCCGYYNSAFGYWALENNSGEYNTAIGNSALWNGGNGSWNTAAGAGALFWNTGDNNSAVGFNALEQNSSGGNNTAMGYQSLGGNESSSTRETGSSNTAVGASALYSNEAGSFNTASGYKALYFNKNGAQNSAFGTNALVRNGAGNYNTASGTDALFSNTTGSQNIAEGYKAGYNLTTGSNNIDIGSTGAAAESGIIRIGSTAQTEAYIAGISGSKVTGSAVYVTSAGRLGVLASSERYKTAIAPIGSDAAKLEQLRPVSFKLKNDATGARQYGLIAEEVAKVYPELVIHDANGRIDGVRYEELAPLLLNEVQQQQQKISAQNRHSADQDLEIHRLKQQFEELRALDQATQAAMRKLQAKE